MQFFRNLSCPLPNKTECFHYGSGRHYAPQTFALQIRDGVTGNYQCKVIALPRDKLHLTDCPVGDYRKAHTGWIPCYHTTISIYLLPC